MINIAVMTITPTSPPTMIPATAPADRPSSDFSSLSEVGLTDGKRVGLTDDKVLVGVINILETTLTSTVDA